MIRLLAPILAFFALLRFGRTLMWLLFRPGGWIVLIGAAVLWLSFLKT